jgi:dehydrogenase/reductase SDR family protein 4
MKCKRYEGKVVLVTGSTEGIGYAMVERFGLEGATVIVSSRKEQNTKKAEESLQKQNIKCDAIVCNFNNLDDRKKIFEYIKEKYGRLDVLVCNVAVSPYFGPAINIGEREFDKIFETNVKNTFFTIKDAFPLLKLGKNSNILIVSSTAGYTPFPLIGVYSISKTVLFSMTKLLAEELAQYSIRVNCVAPGIVKTKFASAILDTEQNNFMKRYATPEEISGTAAYLCSEDGSFVTGETVCVNGGMFGRL